MKKVKVTVNAGSPGRTFPVFNSSESAYVWLTEAHADPTIIDRIPETEHVALLPGEFIEAEWRGCEYVYNGPSHMRLDLILFAKAHQPDNASGLLVSVHYGWVNDYILPFRAFSDNDITVQPLTVDEQKFDLAVLSKNTKDNKKIK